MSTVNGLWSWETENGPVAMGLRDYLNVHLQHHCVHYNCTHCSWLVLCILYYVANCYVQYVNV